MFYGKNVFILYRALFPKREQPDTATKLQSMHTGATDKLPEPTSGFRVSEYCYDRATQRLCSLNHMHKVVWPVKQHPENKTNMQRGIIS